MKRRSDSTRYAALAGLASAAFIAGCSSEKEKWANSPGAKGFINLEAVKEAFLTYPVVDEFENRVNEIYEGQNLILVSAEKRSDGFMVSAKEDLNGNKEVDSNSEDDLLFTIEVHGTRATLKGEGVNGYYNESFYYDPRRPDERYISSHPHYHHNHAFWYWHSTPLWGGYYTPATRYVIINNHRQDYRSSPTFQKQIRTNDSFATSQSAKHGSRFASSVNSTSQARKGYISRTKSNFARTVKAKGASSSWGTRSKMASKGYSGSKAFSGRSISSGSGGKSSFGGFRGSSGSGV